MFHVCIADMENKDQEMEIVAEAKDSAFCDNTSVGDER
jgi:hypothetical protein